MMSKPSVVNNSSPPQPMVDPDGGPIDMQLYEQLGELARFIDTTLKTISQFRDPMSATTEQLPQAVTHLRDLKRLTEEGTHTVMRLVESIQDNHQSLTRLLTLLTVEAAGMPDADRLAALERGLASLAEDERRLTDIVTALSFQDLVAQRINKLVTIVDEVEHKLLELVVVFGPYTKGAGVEEAGRASEMLKQLEASKSTAMSQDLADEILKQFGFN